MLKDMLLHAFSYQPVVTVNETPNLHNRKATDSQLETALMFQLPRNIMLFA